MLCLCALACQPEGDNASCQIERRGATQAVVLVRGDCSHQDFAGLDLSDADVSAVTWGQGATCPDGTLSGDNGGTCLGHLSPSGGDLANMQDIEDTGDAQDNNDASLDWSIDTSSPDLPPEDMPEDAPPEDAGPDMCAPNACGGCGALPGEPGQVCGPCNTGTWACLGQTPVCDDTPACTSRLCDSDRDCADSFDTCQEGFCTPMGSILVPAGTYLRGSAPGETALPFDEPRHQVTLTHPLFVQRHEYTQGQWLQERQQERALGDDEGCAQESCPLRDITWLQTLAIANHASAHWGLEPCYHHHEDWLHIPDDLATANYINWVGPGCQGWRLPTSAEWEYFARAGTTSPWSWGDDPNVSQEYAHAPAPTQPDQVADHPQAVGQLRPNPWGLYDIHGNVEEWVWGTEDLYPDPPMHLTNPAFTPVRQHDNFEARGGSFDALTRQLRSDYRLFALSRQSSRRRGVRLVRTVQPQP